MSPILIKIINKISIRSDVIKNRLSAGIRAIKKYFILPIGEIEILESYQKEHLISPTNFYY